jgi:hypothetical protein
MILISFSMFKSTTIDRDFLELNGNKQNVKKMLNCTESSLCRDDIDK